MRDEGEVPQGVNVGGSQGVQTGPGSVQNNYWVPKAPLDPIALSRLRPHAAASRLSSLSDDELADFFATAEPWDVGAILAALLELDEARIVSILSDIDGRKAADLVNMVFVGANLGEFSGAAHRHALDSLAEKPRSAGTPVSRCPACAAGLGGTIPAIRCWSCDARLVTDLTVTSSTMPDAILPSQVDSDGVRTAFAGWIASRWFAPRSFEIAAEAAEAEAAYIPFWSFNAMRITDYVGQSGTKLPRTSEDVDKNKRAQSQESANKEWGPKTPGTLKVPFVDLLVPACRAVYEVAHEKLLDWPVSDAVAFPRQFLGAFPVVQHDVGPTAAFTAARNRMDRTVQNDCKADIGGDDQIVLDSSTRYREVTYALILLPMWFLRINHQGQAWQFVINGRTGEVLGRRPYSRTGITSAVFLSVFLASLIAILGFVIAR